MGDDMQSVSRTLHYAAFRFGHINRMGAYKVVPVPEGLTGMPVVKTDAEVSEWHIHGEPVARSVKACGDAAYWLRRDIADMAYASLQAEAEENERMIGTVKAYAAATRLQAGTRPRWVPSVAMVEAAARHAARIGRLNDRNSRGDSTRARFVEQLRQAREAEDKRNG